MGVTQSLSVAHLPALFVCEDTQLSFSFVLPTLRKPINCPFLNFSVSLTREKFLIYVNYSINIYKGHHLLKEWMDEEKAREDKEGKQEWGRKIKGRMFLVCHLKPVTYTSIDFPPSLLLNRFKQVCCLNQQRKVSWSQRMVRNSYSQSLSLHSWIWVAVDKMIFHLYCLKVKHDSQNKQTN